MGELLTGEQLDLLLPGPENMIRRRHIPLGTPLCEAVARPGIDWAQNAVLAGYVPSMESLGLMLRARMLPNRAHLMEHKDAGCSQSWECLDVVPTYWRWSAALQREAQLHLCAARNVS